MARKYKKQRHAHDAKSTSDLVARPKHLKIKAHHTKPYRKRHFGLLLVAFVFFTIIVFQAGLSIGGSRIKVVTQTPTVSPAPSQKSVASSYGFSLKFDDSLFSASATAIDAKGNGQAVSENQLDTNQQINTVTLRPKAGTIRAGLAATQLSVQVLPGTNELTALKAKPANANKTDAELAAELMPVTSSSDFDVTRVSTGTDTIGDGTPVVKSTYQYTPKFKGGNSYAVVWHGVVKGHPFAIRLNGLLVSSAVPSEYQDIFASFKFEGGAKVEGISFNPIGRASAASPSKIDNKYLSDTVSPSVVKIYHLVCGTLVIYQQSYGKGCEGMTGSGFLVSNDGYIATNGHVAVLTAKDIMVEIVTSSTASLISFLRGAGLTDAQIQDLANNPQQLASILAKIYELPDDQVLLDNKQEVTIVSLGKDPVTFKDRNSLEDAINFTDTDTIKKAEVVGYDYSGKDLLVASSGSAEGFSSSDVALLKISIKNAPLIPISTSAVIQNEKITVLGFPGDAENSLVDNSSLDVSVTNGSVSAIKEAAGGRGKLYQSDADASHGNSGGPAVNESGEVFGLLTYRIAGDDQGNAAKSYMRDVADFTKLVKSKNITLNTASQTQKAWANGLLLYSGNHFSAAKKEFLKVKQAYPAHRLVSGYVDNADKQIAAGNDVKVYPLWLFTLAGVVAIIGLGAAVTLIVRHRARHQAYVSQTPPGSGPPSMQPPAAGQGISTMPPAPSGSFPAQPAQMQPSAPAAPQTQYQTPSILQPQVAPQPVQPPQTQQAPRVLDQVTSMPSQPQMIGRPLPPSVSMQPSAQQSTTITPTVINPTLQ